MLQLLLIQSNWIWMKMFILIFHRIIIKWICQQIDFDFWISSKTAIGLIARFIHRYRCKKKLYTSIFSSECVFVSACVGATHPVRLNVFTLNEIMIQFLCVCHIIISITTLIANKIMHMHQCLHYFSLITVCSTSIAQCKEKNKTK